MAGSRKSPSSTRSLRVRRATLKDLETLVHQRRAMWMDLGVKGEARHNAADKTYRRWTGTRLRNHQLIAWLVEGRDREIAGGGCVWLQPVQPSPKKPGTIQPYLLSMYTSPRFRRRGVASVIVRAAIDWCRRQGFPRLTLHASPMGRGVYQKLGFNRTWEMRLDLDPLARPTGRA